MNLACWKKHEAGVPPKEPPIFTKIQFRQQDILKTGLSTCIKPWDTTHLIGIKKGKAELSGYPLAMHY